MKRFALLDGKPADALPLDPGVLLGDSVFETMRAYAGKPFEEGAHLARLARSAKWARIDTPRDTLAEEASLAAKAIGNAAVRVFLFRSHRLVTAEPIDIDPKIYEQGIRVCVLPDADYGTPETAHAKYARYLPRLLARKEALERGFDDALLCDGEGRIVSAATASVFALIDGVLVSASVLDSITRGVVLRIAEGMNLTTASTPIHLDRASEVFLASSLRELVPIGAAGKITRDLHAAYRALTSRR